MKKRVFSVLALVLVTTTGFGLTAMGAPAEEAPKLQASKTGKEVFCRAKIKFENMLDQTIQIDRLRVSSGSDPAFYSEFELSGSRYRPVSGATVGTPMLDVMVPSGHKLVLEVTFRKQITAGKDPRFSGPKTDKTGVGAIQPTCTLAGQELTIGVDE